MTTPSETGSAWTVREGNGRTYRRLAVPTRWLDGADDLADALREHLPPLQKTDTVIISEKVAILLTGRTVPIERFPASLAARVLVRFVQPRQGSRGLSVPEKMQYVISAAGLPRILLAATASAVTRPFGVHGMFYRVAGSVARDIDGGRPPYEHLLFPPLRPADASEMVDILQRELDTGVAIVDLNDYGGSIRATSERSLPADELMLALDDNPLGQGSRSTPFGIVRRNTDEQPAV